MTIGNDFRLVSAPEFRLPAAAKTAVVNGSAAPGTLENRVNTANPVNNPELFPAAGSRLPSPAQTAAVSAPANTSDPLENKVSNVRNGRLFALQPTPPPAKIAVFPSVRRDLFPGDASVSSSAVSRGPGAPHAAPQPPQANQGPASAPMFEAASKC